MEMAVNRLIQPPMTMEVRRGFSTNNNSNNETATPEQDGGAGGAEGEQEASTAASQEDAAAADDAASTSSKEQELQEQVKNLKDQLLRSLAEQDNTRRIASRDVESARNFAIKSFAKSLLDTSDNLSRALEAVPEDMRTDTENHPVLATLYEGIAMTESGLHKAFQSNGLVQYGDAGEQFDPNLHEALYKYPDPNGTPGTVGQVMKKGFKLNGRVLRSAEVGVVDKAP